MNKLTLKIDDTNYLNKDLENYLSTIDGIVFSKVNSDNNEIYVEYDAVAISLKLLKMEILLYLDIMNTPSIVSFDKHTKNNKEDIIIIKDLCCEYCLKGMIEELLEIDGIESAYSDFDYTDKINVKIFITYDDKLVNKDIIKKLEKKFNS